MNNEKTEKLMNELKEASSLYSYINKHNIDFPNLTLPDFIELTIQKKNLKKSQVINNSGLHRTYAYQILSGQRKPSRDKMIAFAFGLCLNLEESQKMLTIAEFSPLYPKNKRDSIIIYAICNHYDLMSTNDLLYDHGEEVLE